MNSDTVAGAVGAGVLALALVILLALLNMFVTVKSGYIGIITTFGKVTEERQPGLSMKIPFIQGVQGLDVQVQKEQVDASAATKDLQTVTATVALNYHLDHGQVTNVFTNIGSKYVDRVISPDIQETVKAITAKYNAEDLLTYRADIADQMNKGLIERLQHRGIIVDQVSIVNFAFSPQFTTAIEAKQSAQQAALQAQYTLDKAQKDAQANQVQQAALTDQILEQQAIAKWNGVLPGTVAGQSTIFGIPLGK